MRQGCSRIGANPRRHAEPIEMDQIVILNGVCDVKNPEKDLWPLVRSGILRCAQNDRIVVTRLCSVLPIKPFRALPMLNGARLK
jgi:hypothetical protein